jgi:hypothetical protein
MGGVRNGAQVGAQTPQHLRRNHRREVRRQLSLRDSLDSGKNIRRPAAVKPARHDIRGQGHADPSERVGKHCASDLLTIDKYAIAIEDDHGPSDARPKESTVVPPFRIT